jgi:phosphatidylglycerophosphate synthase
MHRTGLGGVPLSRVEKERRARGIGGMKKQDTRFHWWTLVHSFLCLTAGITLLGFPFERLAMMLLFIFIPYGIASFLVLLLLQWENAFRVPNLISLIRLIIGTVVLSLFQEDRNTGYPEFFLLAAAGFSDMLDGLVARRLGSTPFGAKLDMELDAYFIFLLSVICAVSRSVGSWILTAGLIRYAYVFVLLSLPEVQKLPGIVRWTEKSIAAFSTGALVALTAPFLPLQARELFGFVTLALLGSSFLLDMVYRILYGRTSTRRKLGHI